MDKQLWQIIKKEIKRQLETIELIPSENFVDLETLFIVGSPLINKYAEGYPDKRYYPGNKFVDKIENLAKKRALKAFQLSDKKWTVNVQPYSGSPANLATLLALASPGETIMGLNLFHGGHLTHGHKVSYSGKIFNSIPYKINNQGKIDYNELKKLAIKFKPKVIISGTTAYPRTINFKLIYEISKKVNAYHLADISHIAGLVIAKLHPSPFPYADVVTTTTHKTLKGNRSGVIFCKKELEDKINKSVFPGLQGGPHLNIIAGIAYTFHQASSKKFNKYQKQIIKNAQILSKELKKYGFKLYTNGTDNHLMIIDLKPLNLDAKKAEILLEKANIIANRNSLPQDTSAFYPSGIRLGTPAITSRNMKEKEMKLIAKFFKRILINKEKPILIKKEVVKMTKNFPLFYNKWIKIIKKLL